MNASSQIPKMPAVEISKRVTSRQISAIEVLDAFLDHIDRHNPAINAFALLNREGARAAAHDVDTMVKSGKTDLPLAGVPFHVKDLIPTKGVETSFGSYAMEGNIPKADAHPVALAKQAGAVLIGKSTTAEFGSAVLTNTDRYGITRNPWNLEHTAGGSSGGAASAIAAGFGPLGISTDGAGSARIPASCCGILGLKPSLGLVANELWPLQYETNTYIGANTRNTHDLAALLSVMNGPHPLDPWTAGRTSRTYSIAPEPTNTLRGLKILYVSNMGNKMLDNGISTLMDRMVGKFTNAGAEISLPDPDFEWLSNSCRAAFLASYAARFGGYVENSRDLLGKDIASRAEAGAKVPAKFLREAPLERVKLFNRVESLFTDVDIILSPTLTALPPRCDFDATGPITINGKIAGNLFDEWFTYPQPFNLTGHPAMSIPAGNLDGLPVGMQIVGRNFSEQTLINIAAAVEILNPWAGEWPSTAG